MEEDTDPYCRFGTPLEPLEEDEVPSKKPIAIEDQIVTDANGKRRFHGAFTGGFSAGFWNTVGSLEGWKPQSFKSSRSEKAEKQSQRAIDFMDDEDLGEFGIAPQRIQTTKNFTRADDKPSSSAEKIRKRKLEQSLGPIPGVPVLHQLLQPAKENIAVRLLKKMGWKEGQGIGARQTRKEKKLATERNSRESYIMKKYGCDLGPFQQETEKDHVAKDEDESDLSDDEITFAPDDFEAFICNIKTNTFGIGYKGLSRDPVLKKQQHINLFGDAFELVGKDNKKLSIRGQAFGVGALEEDDEDIYAKDDMARYDFTLGGDPTKKKKEKEKVKSELGVLEGFVQAQHNAMYTKKVFVITLPENFKPRNWAMRKSRFEPLDRDLSAILRIQDEKKVKGLGRHDLDPDQRGEILGEKSSRTENVTKKLGKGESEPELPKKKTYLERINEKYKNKQIIAGPSSFLDKLTASADKFTKKEILNDDGSTSKLEEETRKENEKVLAKAEEITKNIDKTPGIFKPFAGNPAKQERYEKFLEANPANREETEKFLTSIQPLSMSDWDREFECKEFIQARNIYQPLKGFMSDRFVSETTIVAEKEVVAPIKANKTIKIVRTKAMWKPSSNLCKRFNIAEPFGGTMIDEKKEKKKPRFSVFDYLEMSVNRKEDFVTPVILPTKAERPKPIVSQTDKEGDAKSQDSDSAKSRSSTKEMFASEVRSSKIEWDQVREQKSTTTETEAGTVKKKPMSSKNKSELEKKIEAMKDKHPSEKKDLFKAIFDSDSEEEESTEEKSGNKVNASDTTNASRILDMEAHKDIFAATKQSAAEINVLRNTSPPRGIFANLFTKKTVDEVRPKEDSTKKVIEKSESNSIVAEDSTRKDQKSNVSVPKITFKPHSERVPQPDPEDVYGPRMPVLPTPSSAKLAEPVGTVDEGDVDTIDKKLLKLLKKSKKESIIVEQWVEKSSCDSGKKKRKKSKDRETEKKKKSKKHKKDKKRHKNEK